MSYPARAEGLGKYDDEKERKDSELKFLSSFLLLFWNAFPQFAFSVQPLYGDLIQNGAREISSPYIFVASIQLIVFTSSRLATTPSKCVIPFPPIGVSGKNIRFRWFHTYAEGFKPRVFPNHFNYNECLGLDVRRLSSFIYLFIWLFF